MDAPSEVKTIEMSQTPDAAKCWRADVSGRVGAQTLRATGAGNTGQAALDAAYKNFVGKKLQRAVTDEQPAEGPIT